MKWPLWRMKFWSLMKKWQAKLKVRITLLKKSITNWQMKCQTWKNRCQTWASRWQTWTSRWQTLKKYLNNWLWRKTESIKTNFCCGRLARAERKDNFDFASLLRAWREEVWRNQTCANEKLKRKVSPSLGKNWKQIWKRYLRYQKKIKCFSAKIGRGGRP